MRSRQKKRQKRAMLKIAKNAEEAASRGQTEEYNKRHRAYKDETCEFRPLFILEWVRFVVYEILHDYRYDGA